MKKSLAIILLSSLALAGAAAAEVRAPRGELTAIAADDCANPTGVLAIARETLRVSSQDASAGRGVVRGAISLDGLLTSEVAGPAEVALALVGTLNSGMPYFAVGSPVDVPKDSHGHFIDRKVPASGSEIELRKFVLRSSRDGLSARMSVNYDVALAGATLADFMPGTLQLFFQVTLQNGTNACGTHDVVMFLPIVIN